MTHELRKQVWDKFSGQLLGTVVHIDGDQVTYKALGIPTFHTIKMCWVYVWEG